MRAGPGGQPAARASSDSASVAMRGSATREDRLDAVSSSVRARGSNKASTGRSERVRWPRTTTPQRPGRRWRESHSIVAPDTAGWSWATKIQAASGLHRIAATISASGGRKPGTEGNSGKGACRSRSRPGPSHRTSWTLALSALRTSEGELRRCQLAASLPRSFGPPDGARTPPSTGVDLRRASSQLATSASTIAKRSSRGPRTR